MPIKTVKEDEINQIVADVAANFRCFGLGSSPPVIEGNPIAAALAEQEPQFAAGVDVREVVEYVVSRLLPESEHIADTHGPPTLINRVGGIPIMKLNDGKRR